MKKLEGMYSKFIESSQLEEVLDCCVIDSTSDMDQASVLAEIKSDVLQSFDQTAVEREKTFQELGYKYYQSGSPVVNLIAVLNFFHQGFLRYLSEKDLLNRHFDEVNTLFNDLKNAATKGYLYKDLDELEYVFMAEFKDKLEISPHTKWIKKVIHSIRTNNTSDVPAIEEMRRELEEWLARPETRILLGDELEWVQILHQSIQQLAVTLTQDMPKKNYLQMFILAKEIGKKTLYFLHTLNDLYLSFIEHREKRFVDFIHTAVGEGEISHVTVLNIQNLDAMTRIWGDTVRKIIMEKVERRLTLALHSISPSSFFMEAQKGKIFIFYTDRFNVDLVGHHRRLKKNLEQETIQYEGNTITFHTSLASVGFLKGEKLSRDLIKKVLAFATTKADLTNDGFYCLDAEDKRAVVSSIIRSYQQIQFVQNTLNEKNIELFFQPVVQMESKEVYNLEALARIITPDAIISAKDFIQTVYDLGMILKLDSLVFERIRDYQDRIRSITDKIFLNVSPHSLKSAAFRNVLKKTVADLKRSGLTLTIELTEQAVLENVDVISFINEHYGVRFAIDDFGTGYSSLYTVASLAQSGAVGYLKVDGEMIRGMESSAETFKVVNTIVNMSYALHLKTIPEFVETESIAHRLIKMGVTMGQGNYFCPASPIESILSH